MIFLLSNLVFLHEDSLLFMNGDNVVDAWRLEHCEPTLINGTVYHERTKISDDRKYFFIFYSRQDTNRNFVSTAIKFYNSKEKLLFHGSRESDRMINYDLTEIDNNALIYVDCIGNAEDPQLHIVMGGKTIIPIRSGEWKRIVSYDLSDNNKYLVTHVRNPYMGKLWDYVFFYDLKTGKSWQYLFPLCLSCKRTRINVSVNNKGVSDIEYKKEHRVFSKQGDLIDFYIEK